MNSSTRAIVIYSIKYKESGLISHFFTEEKGLTPVVCHGVRKGKKNKSAYFNPLNLCELNLSQKDPNGMFILKEIKNYPAYFYCRNEMSFGPIFMFISGLLKYVLARDNENKALFRWIWSYLSKIEQEQLAPENIPIHFTVNLLQKEGLLPDPQMDPYLSQSEQELISTLIEVCSQRSIEQLEKELLSGKREGFKFIIHALATNMQNKKILDLYQQVAEIYA